MKDWKVGISKGKYGQMGEELEAKRPGDEKKNKKWHPDCGSTNTLAIHPLKRVEETKQCIFGNQRLGNEQTQQF